MRNVIHAFIFRVATRTCGLLSIGNMHVAITFGVASRSLDYHVSLAIKYQQVIGAIANVRRFIISSVSCKCAIIVVADTRHASNVSSIRYPPSLTKPCDNVACLAKWTIAKDWERVNMDTFATICISLVSDEPFFSTMPTNIMFYYSTSAIHQPTYLLVLRIFHVCM